MSHITRDVTYMIVAAGVFLASLCVPGYLYWQTLAQQGYVAQVAGALATQAGEEEAAAKTRQVLEDTAQARAKLDALAPPADGVADFISTIERDGAVSGVSLEVGNVSANTKNPLFDEVSLTFKATGSFAATYRFLLLLETLPYASTVHSVIIGRNPDKAGSWAFTGEIHVPVHKQSS